MAAAQGHSKHHKQQSAAASARRLLVRYQVQTVRIGVQTTILVVLALVLFALLPAHGPLDLRLYAPLLLTATMGAMVVAFLPWTRLFDAGLGLWCLYAWAVLDILLITAGIAITGDGTSEFFVLYGLIIVFFAASYPPRGQVILLGLTFLCYLGLLAASHAAIRPAWLFLRLSSLGLTAYLASFLSRRLLQEMGSHHAARTDSDRRAGLLMQVTAAARAMSTLDPEQLLNTIVDAAVAQGYAGATIWIFDERNGDRVVRAPRSAEASDPPTTPDRTLPSLREIGVTTRIPGRGVATPVWLHGRLAAVLLGSSATHDATRPDVEALELLAAQAGRALENADYADDLKQREERFRSLVQHAQDGVVVIDADGAIDYASPAVERITGSGAGTLQGTPVVTLIHPDDVPIAQAEFAAVLTEGGTTRMFEMRVKHAEGGWRWVEVTLTDLRHVPGVRGVVANYHDITERKLFQEQLTHQAFHDILTGLPNRASFRNSVELAVARCGRNGGSLAVLFVDLDRFKVVNDSLGHDAGDRLLVAVAARLRDCARSSDIVARLGGDEFTVLLEDVHEESESARVAERILEALRAPFSVGGRDLYISGSIGIAVHTSPLEGVDDLLRHADIAMYRAKESGKACYEVFDAAMSARAKQRLELEAGLRRAIGNGELLFLFQPLVSLATGRLSGVEALVRWQHPQQGLLEPGRFIPLAEETGLILPLGHWVLREGCRRLRAWQDLGLCRPPFALAINVSAVQFNRPELVDEVEAALRESDIDAGSLTLEITESVLMHDTGAAERALRRLKALGVSIAIDDFGTGYSSLAYLRRYPIDTLKIDRSFVRDIEEDAEAAALVDGIIKLGRTLHLQTVAEGIERREQVARLRMLGCTFGQGYLFARPIDAEAMSELMRLARDDDYWSVAGGPRRGPVAA